MSETGRNLGGRIAGWCAEEGGAARLDRIFLAFGVVALAGLLAFSMIGRDAPRSPAEAGRAASTEGGGPADLPERRVISATGRTLPEPPRVEGVQVGPTHVSKSYLQRFEPRPDNEQAILSAQTQQAIAEEQAAGAAAVAEETGLQNSAGSEADGS